MPIVDPGTPAGQWSVVSGHFAYTRAFLHGVSFRAVRWLYSFCFTTAEFTPTNDDAVATMAEEFAV